MHFRLLNPVASKSENKINKRIDRIVMADCHLGEQHTVRFTGGSLDLADYRFGVCAENARQERLGIVSSSRAAEIGDRKR